MLSSVYTQNPHHVRIAVAIRSELVHFIVINLSMLLNYLTNYSTYMSYVPLLDRLSTPFGTRWYRTTKPKEQLSS